MADFLTGNGATGGYSSDSGAETDEEDKAELPQDYVGRQTKAGQKVSIKLVEVGPRLSLSLLNDVVHFSHHQFHLDAVRCIQYQVRRNYL